jgi:hypothetical protein
MRSTTEYTETTKTTMDNTLATVDLNFSETSTLSWSSEGTTSETASTTDLSPTETTTEYYQQSTETTSREPEPETTKIVKTETALQFDDVTEPLLQFMEPSTEATTNLNNLTTSISRDTTENLLSSTTALPMNDVSIDEPSNSKTLSPISNGTKMATPESKPHGTTPTSVPKKHQAKFVTNSEQNLSHNLDEKEEIEYYDEYEYYYEDDNSTVIMVVKDPPAGAAITSSKKPQLFSNEKLNKFFTTERPTISPFIAGDDAAEQYDDYDASREYYDESKSYSDEM